MKIRIAHSNDPAQCVAQLGSDGSAAPKMVLFFASSKLDIGETTRVLYGNFPESQVIGCTTAGEIASGMMTEGSIVAMAIPPEYVDWAATAYIADPADAGDVTAAIRAIEASLGHSALDLDPASYVGIVVVDGLSGAEEKLMDKLGDLIDIPFIGGSSGDDLAFAKTHVALNGVTHDHGAVIAVLHAPKGYQIIKAQSLRSTGRHLTATAVEERTRTVLEFDGQPAVEAYAAALGVPASQLPDRFMWNPLGLMVGDEPYVRSPQRVSGTGIVFYCNMRAGTELDILEATDIIEDTRAAMEAHNGVVREDAVLINFHCILRTLELKAKGQCEAYGRLFADIPTIGFSTYGEEYMGHINQTSTMLMFPGA